MASVFPSTLKKSLTQCGGALGVRGHVVLGSSNFSVVSGGTYIGDPNWTSANKHSATIGKVRSSYSFNGQGSFYPDPSRCFGGGTVDDNWTFNR